MTERVSNKNGGKRESEKKNVENFYLKILTKKIFFLSFYLPPVHVISENYSPQKQLFTDATKKGEKIRPIVSLYIYIYVFIVFGYSKYFKKTDGLNASTKDFFSDLLYSTHPFKEKSLSYG